jgi:excisionase family DNA binding protein
MAQTRVFQDPQEDPPSRSSQAPPRLAYKPHEVAELVGLHVHSVYQAVADGSLPAKRAGRSGRRIIISHEALQQWLAETSHEE